MEGICDSKGKLDSIKQEIWCCAVSLRHIFPQNTRKYGKLMLSITTLKYYKDDRFLCGQIVFFFFKPLKNFKTFNI